MHESPEKNKMSESGIEIKEGEPKVHTVYAYIKKDKIGNRLRHTEKVLAIYTKEEDARKSAELDDMFLSSEDVIIPLKVYERIEDLPDEIRDHIQTEAPDVSTEVMGGKKDVIYAVMPNMDSTEGREQDFIWVLTTNSLLANQIARGNGLSGSNAKVIEIPLDRYPIENNSAISHVNLRRDPKGKMTDELFTD